MNHQSREIGGFRPVRQRATIADNVYQELRTALIVGRFDPGQTLTISSLSEAFHTSHMPVREALRRLAAEGAVEVRGTGSAHVPEVTRAALDDICRARIALERLATGLAVQAITPEEISALERLEQEHTATSHLNNVYEMLEKNHRFHFSIYQAARSPTLLQLIDTLWLRYGPFMRMLSDHIAPQLDKGVHEPFMRGHRAIVDAVRARDPERAADLMQADIERTQHLLQELCA
ncbi:MAG: GntR family transcriptional regulator [Pararhodobacter sp.]|nr:GntR family transcriptional regulator [Pararhodobacter sp.]